MTTPHTQDQRHQRPSKASPGVRSLLAMLPALTLSVPGSLAATPPLVIAAEGARSCCLPSARDGMLRSGAVEVPTVDLYHPHASSMRASQNRIDAAALDPVGPSESFDPRNPSEPRLIVIRGGSFLCNDSYCASYRPSARMATSPDTSLSHAGFRCVRDPSR